MRIPPSLISTPSNVLKVISTLKELNRGFTVTGSSIIFITLTVFLIACISRHTISKDLHSQYHERKLLIIINFSQRTSGELAISTINMPSFILIWATWLRVNFSFPFWDSSLTVSNASVNKIQTGYHHGMSDSKSFPENLSTYFMKYEGCWLVNQLSHFTNLPYYT